MNHLLRLFVFSTLIFLMGCGPDYILEKTYELEKMEWTYSDTLNFEVEIKDSLKIYNLYVELEHAMDFPKQNLYVMIHTKFPSGKRISERVSLEMANKGGVWYGDCNSEWCNYSIPIQQGAYFDAIGNYVFTLEQYMRVDPLPGLKHIAFKIEDTGTSRK